MSKWELMGLFAIIGIALSLPYFFHSDSGQRMTPVMKEVTYYEKGDDGKITKVTKQMLILPPQP